MIIATTYKDEKVYEHFGHTPHFKIYKVNDDNTIEMKVIDNEGHGHTAMAQVLIDEGVDKLICCDIGLAAFKLLEEHNIEIYAGYSDYADVCAIALLKGNLIRATEAVCEDNEGCGGSCGDDCDCGGDCSSCH